MERSNDAMRTPLVTNPARERKHPEIPPWARGTSHFCVPVNNTYDTRENSIVPQKERTKGTRLISSRMRTSRRKRQALAYAVLVLFAIQTYVAIMAATPPLPTPPSPAQGSPPTEFAFLNHTQIVGDEDGYWEVWANGSIYLIAELGGSDVSWGGDLATFSWGEVGCPEWNITQYICTTGIQAFPVELSGQRTLFNLSIPAWCRSRFASLSVQPVYIAQGEINVTLDAPTRVDFEASGDIAVLAYSWMNFTDLKILLDGAVLKNHYSERMDYPCTFVAGVIFESALLYFPARVLAGHHYLDIWGNGTLVYSIVSGSEDFENDLLLDYEELMIGIAQLNPRWANCWGYHILEEYYEELPMTRIMEDQNVQGAWIKESLRFFVPEAFTGLKTKLEIVVPNGHFQNVTIDGDATRVGSEIISGYWGTTSDPVTFSDSSGQSILCPANQIAVPGVRFAGYVLPGWHQVTYDVFRSPLENPQLDLYVGEQKVPILESTSNVAKETDGDCVPDSWDLSPGASLLWDNRTVLEITIPCDPLTQEDVQITIQINKSAEIRESDQFLNWHPEDDVPRQVAVVPVMIAYGPGTAPDSGPTRFWDSTTKLAEFLGGDGDAWPVASYDLVDVEDYSHVPEGRSELPGYMDPLPQPKAKVFDYQMLIFPRSAENLMEFDLNYPADHLAIRNDHVIDLRLRWVYAIVEELTGKDYSVLGWYDFDSNLTITGISATFSSHLNALLGKAVDKTTHDALWYYNQNPQISIDWAGVDKIEDFIAAEFRDAHLMPQFNYDPADESTWGIVERLNNARNATPWTNQTAEVTYITQTTRHLDVLSKINQSVHFDLTTGEEYCVYPKMYDFSPIAPGRYLNPGFALIPGWTCTEGMGNVNILRNVQTHANVLQIESSIPSSPFTIHGDPGRKNDTGVISFSVFLESSQSRLEVRAGDGETPDALAVVCEGGFLKYRDKHDDLQKICELWPQEWIDINIFFDNASGDEIFTNTTREKTFMISLGGAKPYAIDNLTYWHPASEIQTIHFTVTGGRVDIDGIGLYWGNQYLDDNTMEKSYEGIHYGDIMERVSWFTSTDVYGGAFGPLDPQLKGDNVVLFASYFSGVQHAMERARVYRWPVSLHVVRAEDLPHDGFNVENFLNASFAQGTNLPAAWLPGQDGTPFSWVGRDVPDTVAFQRRLFNERVTALAGETPPTINRDPGDEEKWEMDWRVGEVDRWEDLHTRHAEAPLKTTLDAKIASALLAFYESYKKMIEVWRRLQIPQGEEGYIADFSIEIKPLDGPGNVLYNPFWHGFINVQGWGAEAVSQNPRETWFKIVEYFNKAKLQKWVEDFLVAISQLLNILFAVPGQELWILRPVQLNPKKISKLPLDLQEKLKLIQAGEVECFSPADIARIDQDCFHILPAHDPDRGSYKHGVWDQTYTKLVIHSVIDNDQRVALWTFMTASLYWHVWTVALYRIFDFNAARHGSLTLPQLFAGEPGQEITFYDQQVTLPQSNEKDWLTIKTPNGESFNIRWVADKSYQHGGYWAWGNPISPIDPNNI